MLKFVEAIQKYTDNKPIVLDGIIDDKSLKIFCPWCLSDDTENTTDSCTCLGGKPDPNHYWGTGKCLDCRQSYRYEHHIDNISRFTNKPSTNVWFTELIDQTNSIDDIFGIKNTIARLGISNCCKTASFYECKCGGLIAGIHTKLDGITRTTCLSFNFNGPGSKDFKSFIVCNKCDLKEEVDDL